MNLEQNQLFKTESIYLLFKKDKFSIYRGFPVDILYTVYKNN